MDEGDLELRREIAEEIREALDSYNPYVQQYRVIRDTIRQDSSSAIKLRILGKRGRNGHRYNLPTASEVAALIVGDFDTSDFDRDVIVDSIWAVATYVSL